MANLDINNLFIDMSTESIEKLLFGVYNALHKVHLQFRNTQPQATLETGNDVIWNKNMIWPDSEKKDCHKDRPPL